MLAILSKVIGHHKYDIVLFDAGALSLLHKKTAKAATEKTGLRKATPIKT